MLPSILCRWGKEPEGPLEGPGALVSNAAKAFYLVVCVCGASKPKGLEGSDGVGVRRRGGVLPRSVCGQDVEARLPVYIWVGLAGEILLVARHTDGRSVQLLR